MAKKSDVIPPAPARLDSRALLDAPVANWGDHLDLNVTFDSIFGESGFRNALEPSV
jgi:hypothetical protein